MLSYPPDFRSHDARHIPLGTLLRAILFVLAGCLHFILPHAYMRIMPPYLPYPLALIYLSGLAEALGGVGLMIPRTRHAAGWGLVALLVAVWPANIYMATAHLEFPGILGQSWAQWLRVVLQIPLLCWVWIDTQTQPRHALVPDVVQVEDNAGS